ncbi:hypothetical protein [Numidum massiliense]|uniref:hypothetical protein n=1 Tax=Numidum massiliense TaxID=1522315 RepID=UPI0011CB4A18|nr:hypothetical protein [Numidum massiliense]
MSYDSRINRLQQVIAELTHAPKVEAVDLSPADSKDDPSVQKYRPGLHPNRTNGGRILAGFY